MIAVILVLCALAVALGAARVFVWILDRQDAQHHSQLRAAQLLTDAELEAHIAALERAWRMPDPSQLDLFGDAQ